MSTLSNKNIARAIYLALRDNTPLSKIVRFLARRRLIGKSSEILSQLKNIANEDTGTIEAKVSSAKTLKGEVKKKLENILAKRYGAKNVAIRENIDENLLGGFRVEVNDEVIDLTFRNKIDKLQEHLTRLV